MRASISSGEASPFLEPPFFFMASPHLPRARLLRDRAHFLRPPGPAFLELVDSAEAESCLCALLELVPPRRAEEARRVVLPSVDEPDSQRERGQDVLALEVVDVLSEQRLERRMVL